MKETLTVKGMSCNNCVNHVKNALNEIEGIEVINIDLVSGNVEINNEAVSKETLVKAIDDIGYVLE